MGAELELLGADAGTVGAQGLGGLCAEQTLAHYRGAAGVDTARSGGEFQVGRAELSTGQVELGGMHAALACGDGLAVQDGSVGRTNVQLPAAGDAAIGRQTGDDRGGGRGVDPCARTGGLHRGVALGRDKARIADAPLGAQAGLGMGVHRAAVAEATHGLDLRVAGGLDLPAVAEPAIVVQDDFTGTGTDKTAVAHAQAGFGADQKDFVGVHAAELAHVECKARGRSTACDGGGCAEGVGGDLVRPGGHTQVGGPDACIDLHGPRQNIGVVRAARVQPAAVDGDGALLHPVGVQTAAVQQRAAGGQGDATGVDEAAAVDLDPCRVGQDDFGALARYFRVPPQVRGVGAVDFVQDDAGTALGQPGVALDVATQLGLHAGAAVVEDGAVAVDVKLLVGIAAHTGRAGGLDVDQGNAVGRGEYGGALVAGGVGVGHDLRQRQRACQHCSKCGQCGSHQRGGCSAGFAGALGGLGHHHAHAPGGVEDDAVQILVHGLALKSCSSG